VVHAPFLMGRVLSELEIRVFLENGLEGFQTFLILQTREAKRIPKTVLKTILKTKETTYIIVFVKYLAIDFRNHSIRAFSVFLKDSLKIISEI
jgi:hypothetical protein